MSMQPNPVTIDLQEKQPNPYEGTLKEVFKKTVSHAGYEWTELTYHNKLNPLQRFIVGLEALIKGLGKLFTGNCCAESVKNKWRIAFSGREVFIVRGPKKKIEGPFRNPKIDIAPEVLPQNAPNKIDKQAPAKIFDGLAPNHPLQEPVFLLFAKERQKKIEDLNPLASEELNWWIKQFLNFSYYEWLGKNIRPQPDPALLQHKCGTIREMYNRAEKEQINPKGPYTFEKCPDFNNLMHAFKNRLEQLEQSIQFKERFDALEKELPNFLKHVQMQDFEVSWKESGLRIALLSTEEFESLTLDQMMTLNSRQKELVEKRLSIKDTSKKEVHFNKGQSFKSLTLAEFRSLDPHLINDFIQDLDTHLLDLIRDDQLKKLDLKKLTDEQFIKFFGIMNPDDPLWLATREMRRKKSEKIAKLESSQLHGIWKRLDPSLFYFISTQQFKTLDFKQLLLNNEQFNRMFPVLPNRQIAAKQSRIRELEVQQIYDLWPLFDEERKAYLSNEQMEEVQKMLAANPR